MQVIIFKNENGGVSVIYPTPEALQSHAIEEVAIKDVPYNKPFKIIDASELAELDSIPQEAWEIDDADLTDGVGGESNEFN
jgi:hypothetical protein